MLLTSTNREWKDFNQLYNYYYYYVETTYAFISDERKLPTCSIFILHINKCSLMHISSDSIRLRLHRLMAKKMRRWFKVNYIKSANRQ
jgi:hypothetical protein